MQNRVQKPFLDSLKPSDDVSPFGKKISGRASHPNVKISLHTRVWWVFGKFLELCTPLAAHVHFPKMGSDNTTGRRLLL